MNIQSTTGIVLKLTKLTDTSLIVTWFTEGFGKLKTVAKGARRPKSPFLGKLDLFYHDDLVFVHSSRSELHILKECALLSAYQGLREDFPLMARASYLCELVELTTEAEHPVPKLFDALREGLSGLEELKREGGDGASSDLVVRRFEMTLFDALGHAPRLRHCCRCEKPQSGDAYFSARAGGLLCERCGTGTGGKIKVEAETWDVLRALAGGGEDLKTLSEFQQKQCEKISAAMLKEVFGVWPKSRQYLT